MPFGDELAVAVALAVGGTRGVADRAVADRVAALAWLPALGAAVGLVAALAVWGVGIFAPPWLAAASGVVVLRAAGAESERGWRALFVGLAQCAAVLAVAPPARGIALVLAAMLGRWASVVQCYGGVGLPGTRGIAALAGRARFREFAIASVTALGATLAALDAVGLGVAVACALLTVGLRLVAYRRRGGIDDGIMNATSALVETSALVLLALIGTVLGRR